MGYRYHFLAGLAETLEQEPAKSMELLEEAYEAGYSQAKEDLTEEVYARAEDRVRVLFEEWKGGFAEGFRKAKEDTPL